MSAASPENFSTSAATNALGSKATCLRCSVIFLKFSKTSIITSRSKLLTVANKDETFWASVGENDLINSPATSGPMAIKIIAAREGPSSD